MSHFDSRPHPPRLQARRPLIETAETIAVYLAFIVVDYVIYRTMTKRWRYNTKGAAADKQKLMRFGGLFTLWVVVPIATAAATSAVASPGAGYGGACLLFAVGFGIIIRIGNRNTFEVDQAKADRGYRIPPARASWIDIGMRRRCQVAYYARRHRAHPDSIVAAVATDWAQWMVNESNRRWHQKLARRIVALAAQPTLSPIE